MKTLSINNIRTKVQLAVLTAVCLALLSITASAHASELKVVGIVSKVSSAAIAVKTRDGKIVQIGLGDQTTYMRLTRPVDRNNMKVGDKVVIHAQKLNTNLVAHLIELGAVV